MNVEAWLTNLGLAQYAAAFAENGVESSLLSELTNEDLKDLGVDRLVDRKSILKAIVSLSESGDEPAAEPPAPTTMAGERRQVTVLFADIAGYTKLSSELGAEETHALLNRYFEAVDSIVEGYGGSVDKHIGDNVMAVFGAPVAHDDDPLRAVRAALDIHQRMATLSDDLGYRLQVHVGIANGQVVASGTGSDAHREYTVTGESVNLASRLQDQAAPGETLVSNALYHAVAAAVDCEALGDVEVKGLDVAVRVWRVAALCDTAEQAKRSVFVGRRAELRQFTSAIEACRETGHGEVFVVRGEAGIGKTRLVEEFTMVAADQGFASHRGLVLDFGVGKGQDAIRSVVRSLLGIAPSGGKAARRAAAEAAIADGFLTADQRVFLNDLLDLPQPVDERVTYDAMDNATRNEGKRVVVADLIRGSSADAPLVVIVEDVHWADQLMLTHLARMASAVADNRALLVMTSRTEGDPIDPAWRATTGGCPLMTIDLSPLRRDEALKLAGAYIDVTDQFAQDCIERAAGNPLFLEQLLRDAEERGDDDVPASIQSLVLARMDRLAPTDKRALQAASVIGQRFALDVLRHLLDVADYDCSGLRNHLLVRPEGDDYLFAHALIQEGVYSSLLKATRHQLHERAAAWFADHDLVLRAQHLDRATDPNAVAAYLAAARQEEAHHRLERALELAERGLTLAQVREARYELTMYRGELLQALETYRPSIVAYKDALEIATSDIERCDALIGQAVGLIRADQHSDAEACLHKAESIASSLEIVHLTAQIHRLYGTIEFVRGNTQASFDHSRRAMELAKECDTPLLEAQALSTMADSELARGKYVSAHDLFSRCVEICRKNEFHRFALINLKMLASIALYQGQFQKALTLSFAVIEESRRIGNARAEFLARQTVGYVYSMMDRPDEAKVQISEARERIIQLHARRFLTSNNCCYAMAARTAGNRTLALKYLAEAEAVANELNVLWSMPWVLGQRAFATKDAKEREEALEEGERLLQSGVGDYNSFEFYVPAIEACIEIEDWDSVERYATALENYTRVEPLGLAQIVTARGRALAKFGRGHSDDATMQELKRLYDEAERIGWRTALPALDEALATVKS